MRTSGCVGTLMRGVGDVLGSACPATTQADTVVLGVDALTVWRGTRVVVTKTFAIFVTALAVWALPILVSVHEIVECLVTLVVDWIGHCVVRHFDSPLYVQKSLSSPRPPSLPLVAVRLRRDTRGTRAPPFGCCTLSLQARRAEAFAA